MDNLRPPRAGWVAPRKRGAGFRGSGTNARRPHLLLVITVTLPAGSLAVQWAPPPRESECPGRVPADARRCEALIDTGGSMTMRASHHRKT